MESIEDLKQHLIDIANATRAKNKETVKYSMSEIAGKIMQLPTGGVTIHVSEAVPNSPITIIYPSGVTAHSTANSNGECDVLVTENGLYTISDTENSLQIFSNMERTAVLKIPAEYQQTEYIENTASAPWSFGISGGSKATFDLKATLTNPGSGGYMRYFGTTDYSLTTIQALLTNGYNGRGGFFSGTSNAITGTGITAFTFHTNEDNSGTINRTNYNNFAGKNTGWGDIPWTVCNGLSSRLYYLKMYTDGNTVRDLIPCYRKSDSAIGMYDKISKQLFVVPDTSKFVIGPNVQP